MPLQPGDKLGPYECIALIGKGGMGEVWKAHDPRLKRDVAIKVSAAQFSERFEREAQAIAALNHSNICQLYDVGPNYLVMEYIEGTPLKGPLPVDQALKYAAQICDALDAAHKKGITHRDLKPANILATKAGIKLLDFGLAKLGSSGIGQAPKPLDEATLTMALTGKNEIVGTLYYMSPEQLQAQANGQEMDGRSDIFSFGLVLYEMLTGKRAFEGSSPASVIAAIMERPAPSIVDVAPAALDRVLRKCLAKDPDERWQTARDLKDELQWIASVPASEAAASAAPSGSRLSNLAWAPTAAMTAIAAVSGLTLWAPWRAAPEPPKPVRFQIAPRERISLALAALSPDGSKLAYEATGSDDVARVWIRPMDALEPHTLPGTEGVPAAPLFWSYDGRFVVFVDASRKLKRVDVAGGPPQTLCDLPTTAMGGSGNRDGVIVFGLSNGAAGIERVSSAGGVPSAVTVLNATRKDRAHGFPVFLPDGRHFLYFVQSTAPENTGIYLGSIDAQPDQQPSRRLVASAVGAGFVPFADGKRGAILFDRDGTLLAQPFDLRRLETAGEAVPVAEQVGSYLGYGFFSVSENGVLAYRAGASGANNQLTWVDREGKSLGVVGQAHDHNRLRLSPDGTRIAAVRGFEETGSDIWLTAISGGGDTRFTFDPAPDDYPTWSPDGSRIAFSSDRTGNFDLYVHASDGAGEDELLFRSDHTKFVTDWSHDGRFLLYYDIDPKTKRDLWVLPMDGAAGERKPVPFLRTGFNEASGTFSPDGHWVAYHSDESGRNEIYVRPFPAPSSGGGKWMVSQGGGILPVWRGDGKELFFQAPDGSIMAAAVMVTGGATSAALQPGPPKALFKTLVGSRGWDATADGKKFLLAVPVAVTAQTPFTIVLNWMSLLTR